MRLKVFAIFKGTMKLEVIKTLIEIAKMHDYGEIYVNEIYFYNIASQKTLEKAGFKRYKETERDYSYILKLKE